MTTETAVVHGVAFAVGENNRTRVAVLRDSILGEIVHIDGADFKAGKPARIFMFADEAREFARALLEALDTEE